MPRKNTTETTETDTTVEKATRTKQDPTAKAQSALDAANKRVARLEKALAGFDTAQADLASARAVRDYAAQHPLLAPAAPQGEVAPDAVTDTAAVY